MSIEVKQVIIKSTLVHGSTEEEGSVIADADIERLKEEVMEACREMIEQSLNNLQER